jgi:hypothetical protein
MRGGELLAKGWYSPSTVVHIRLRAKSTHRVSSAEPAVRTRSFVMPRQVLTGRVPTFPSEPASLAKCHGPVGAWIVNGCVLLLVGFCAGAFTGCAGAAGTVSVHNGGEGAKKATLVTHEPCDLNASNAQRQDVNGDGRADIIATGKCRAYDLNFDGKVDAWVYLDGQGKIRRRELDFDRDGALDEIQLYQNGDLVEKQRCTALRNRLDTWDKYQGGKLVQTERDANGDGIVDQWWEYRAPGCPVIRSDLDRDGVPDPDTAVDYCKETGYTPPERGGGAAGTSPSFERAGATPQEVQNQAAQAPETPSSPPEKAPPKPNEKKP